MEASSNQTTQNTNTSDSSTSYPILFQLQSSTDRRNIGTETVLSAPYTTRKGTAHSQAMKRVRITLALVGILLIVVVIFVLSFYLPDSKTKQIGKGNNNPKKIIEKVNIGALEFDIRNSSILVRNTFAKTAVKIKTTISNASIQSKQYDGKIIIKQADISLTLSLDMEKPTAKCWNISLEKTKQTSPLKSCVDISNSHWYGVGEIYHQKWLLENVNIDMAPFVTHNFLADKSKANKNFGGVLEPYFLSSKGIAILIDRDIPLHMSINSPVKNELCFQSKSPSKYKELTKHILHYTVCTAKDAKEVHKIMLQKFFLKPFSTPDLRMLTDPVWSTWARFKTNVSQDKILEFAKEIKANNMPVSHIEIDDKYSTAYGDFDFDQVKFPDPVKMVEKLHNETMRVTVWVYPFANLDSKALSLGADYWVKSGSGPGIIKWWNGYGAVLDATNKKGVKWFKNRLKSFRNKYKLDSFKFDAGEVQYLPEYYNLNTSLKNINYFSKKYVEIASTFGGLTEVRVGYNCQKYALFFRILDRSSSWSLKNGLKSVLTSTLTFGILGYPFVLPDMVGGNAYDSKPEKELYIRWTQLSIFLPSIQFSIAPWDYDNETLTLVQNALEIRKNISNDIIKFAKISANTGEPIVRPLWWQAPFDMQAHAITSQFLIGDKYLVAPVLEKGAQIRTVHIVNGTWQEMFGSKNIINVGKEGKKIQYNVKLKDIIYFKNLLST